MRFQPLAIPGAFLVGPEPIGDRRGWFARGFCQQEFAEHGIDFEIRQANRSFNGQAGTLRGFHGQFPPHAEQKLLRCVQGCLVDALVDLRPESPTFLQSVLVELSAENQRSLLIPERCCHALQTQCDATEILYLVSAFYAPEAEFGLRWDDPQLAIAWPLPVSEISEKDASWPLLSDSLPTIRTRMTMGGGMPK
ncbi:MAG: dTDP-4-dehydrorhamnose 3,5-epimerase family protein [Synechococcus sp.]|nr:dTDP-4-dehydrorhamnose 3,5-epimerase family protein [Synechococcus sp.]